MDVIFGGSQQLTPSVSGRFSIMPETYCTTGGYSDGGQISGKPNRAGLASAKLHLLDRDVQSPGPCTQIARAVRALDAFCLHADGVRS